MLKLTKPPKIWLWEYLYFMYASSWCCWRICDV